MQDLTVANIEKISKVFGPKNLLYNEELFANELIR